MPMHTVSFKLEWSWIAKFQDLFVLLSFLCAWSLVKNRSRGETRKLRLEMLNKCNMILFYKEN